MAFTLTATLQSFAQIADEPLRVPVQFGARALPPTSGNPSSGTVQIKLAGQAARTEAGTGSRNSPIRTVYLEPGKEYIGVHSMWSWRPWAAGIFAAPPGYAIYINGKKRNDLGIVGEQTYMDMSFKIRVVNEARFDGPVGAATSLAGGRILWEVSLGRKRSGEHAGNLMISYDGTDPDHWTKAGTPLGLHFETESVESVSQNKILVYKPTVNGNATLRQIQTPQAVVTIENIVNSSTSYEIRFYHPSQIKTAGNPAVIEPAQLSFPFVTYKVEYSGTPTAPVLTITKTSRQADLTTISGTTVRTETTTVKRTTETNGSTTTFKWLAAAWWDSTSSPLGRPAVRFTRVSSELVETVEAGVLSSTTSDDLTVQSRETRTYADMGQTDITPTAENSAYLDNWKWTAVIEVVADADSNNTVDLRSETLYYNNPATDAAASRGFVYGKRDIGGGWEYYDYSNNTDIFALGQVVGVYRPFLDQTDPSPSSSTPANRIGPNWGAGTNSGTITTLTYSADGSGIKNRLESKIRSL